MKYLAYLGFICLTAVVQTVSAAVLDDMRFGRDKNDYKVVFNLSTAYKYRAFSLKKPDRYVVDFEATRLGFDPLKLNTKGTGIRRIRASSNKKRLRIVLDLSASMKVKSYRIKPIGNYGNRLLLVLSPQKTSAPKATPAKQKRINYRPKQALRDVVVVIDPGHGGKDPGAIGRRGTLEKSVVLAIAKQLQRYINNQAGMKAVLTRRYDHYVGLRQRLNLARDDKADLFISIHADAYKKTTSHGASVYALSQRGATSEAARWLAEKENYSELGGINLDALNDKTGLVRSVLIDLSQTATIGASLELGSAVLKQLSHITKLHHDRVEQARFVVLKSPDIPSILVETGFISNRREEHNLGSSRFRSKIAKAILRGIKAYFASRPPMGTKLYAWRQAKQYKVKSGDSLSQIALQLGVSMAQLKKYNALSSNTLKIGQVIRVPQREALA